MTDLDTDRIRQRLLELRDELEAVAKAGEEGAAIVELDQTKVGRLSRMDAMQAQAMAQASGQRRSETLARIALALKRLDADEYGFCQRCEKPIDPRRLEFDPTVLLCIECANKAESE